MNNFELLRAFVLQKTGKHIDEAQPIMLNGRQVLEVLWPMNELFSTRIHQINSLAYDAHFEVEADEAIRSLVFDGKAWDNVSAQAWRVLLERHIQSMMLALSNEMHGNDQFVPFPNTLSDAQMLSVVQIFLMYQMTLPFPLSEQSEREGLLKTIGSSLTRQ